MPPTPRAETGLPLLQSIRMLAWDHQSEAWLIEQRELHVPSPVFKKNYVPGDTQELFETSALDVASGSVLSSLALSVHEKPVQLSKRAWSKASLSRIPSQSPGSEKGHRVRKSEL